MMLCSALLCPEKLFNWLGCEHCPTTTRTLPTTKPVILLPMFKSPCRSWVVVAVGDADCGAKARAWVRQAFHIIHPSAHLSRRENFNKWRNYLLRQAEFDICEKLGPGKVALPEIEYRRWCPSNALVTSTTRLSARLRLHNNSMMIMEEEEHDKKNSWEERRQDKEEDKNNGWLNYLITWQNEHRTTERRTSNKNMWVEEMEAKQRRFVPVRGREIFWLEY